MKMFDLTGKTAVVTGAAMGIGKSCALRLSEAGAYVNVLDVDVAAGNDVAEACGGSFIQTDVSDEATVKRAMEQAAARTGILDIVVNNAGISLARQNIDEIDTDVFIKHMEVNSLGVLYGMRYARRFMQAGGTIINTSSILGQYVAPGYGSYNASKFAVVGLTKTAAVEYGRDGIRVNCICPTSVNTPMLANFPDGQQEADAFARTSAINSIIEPEHVGALVHFLAADDCPVITGQALHIDCGMTAGVSWLEWTGAAPR
jgi:NAD(P)-dependent dehydrogenase (short-subunit alcohol dehydrogenase family)